MHYDYSAGVIKAEVIDNLSIYIKYSCFFVRKTYIEG